MRHLDKKEGEKENVSRIIFTISLESLFSIVKDNVCFFLFRILIMKIAVNSLLSLLDVGTGFCYWLLGRDLLEEEVKRIQELFLKGKYIFWCVILFIH